jgi:uncharacterized membrane-anchored protein YitT (DUF2179 family)
MAKHKKTAEEPDLAQVAGGIVNDAEQLIKQHFDLLRADVKQELGRAKTAAVSLGAGAGLAALGGTFAALTVVHLLHSSTRLPLWGCYGLVGGVLGGVGLSLLYEGGKAAAGVQLLPQRTTQALREDVDWVKQQAAEATH